MNLFPFRDRRLVAVLGGRLIALAPACAGSETGGSKQNELPDQFLVPKDGNMPPFSGDDIAAEFERRRGLTSLLAAALWWMLLGVSDSELPVRRVCDNDPLSTTTKDLRP